MNMNNGTDISCFSLNSKQFFCINSNFIKQFRKNFQYWKILLFKIEEGYSEMKISCNVYNIIYKFSENLRISRFDLLSSRFIFHLTPAIDIAFHWTEYLA